MALPTLPPLRVIYFSSQPPETTNSVAGLLQQMGLKVLLVITTPGPPARPMTAYKEVAANPPPGVDVLVTNHIKRLAPMLRGLEPDLIFVTGFPWRLPPELLVLPRLGSINTHPALLPRYRGPDPLFWQVMNGEPEVGLTVHRMDAEFDEGPILAQGSAPVGPDEEIEEVVEKLPALAGTLVVQGLMAAIAGEKGTPQPTEGASYARLRTEADRVLDWSRTARQLHNQVRAWGAQGAFADIDGQRWLVRHSRVIEENNPAKGEVGRIVDRAGEGVVVQAGDGLLRLEEVVPEVT